MASDDAASRPLLSSSPGQATASAPLGEPEKPMPSREEVALFLTKEPQESLERMLRAVLKHRNDGNVVFALKRVERIRGSTPASPQRSRAPSQPGVSSEELAADVVQFGLEIFYVLEHEECEVTVLRLGARKGKSSISWHTEDISALAGERYEAADGVLEFEPGEDRKTLKIKIIVDPGWHGSLDFRVVLDGSTAKGCKVGLSLNSTTVKVIDSSSFPTDKANGKDAQLPDAEDSRPMTAYPSLLDRGLPGLPLMIEYWRMNLRDAEIRRRSRKIIFADQLLLSIGYLQLYLGTNFFINTVLEDVTDPEEQGPTRFTYAVMIVLGGFVLPLLLEIWLEIQRATTWGVGGLSRRILQVNLLKKFVAYSRLARGSGAETYTAVLHHSADLAADGFGAMFLILQGMGSFIQLMILQGMVSLRFLLVLLLMALFASIYGRWRVRTTFSAYVAEDEAMASLTAHVTETIDNYRLLQNYQLDNRQADRAVSLIDSLNKAMAKRLDIDVVNKNWVKTITTFLISGYLLAQGAAIYFNWWVPDVADTAVTLQIIPRSSAVVASLYNAYLKMLEASPPLRIIMDLMNRDVEDDERLQMTRKQLATYSRRMAEASAEQDDFAENRLTINMEQVTFTYMDRMNKTVTSIFANVEFPQGELVMVIGKQASGKNSFLRLLAGGLMPDQGEVFLSPHLRSLYVSQEPSFLSLSSLRSNLVLGVRATSPEDGRAERVEKILTRLGVLPSTMTWVQDPSAWADWPSTFSVTQRILLNLSRAFIANPSVLLVQSPLANLDVSGQEKVMGCLVDFVKRRGLEEDPATFHLRHPRTAIISMPRATYADKVDRVLLMRETGVEEIDPREVPSDLS